MRKFKGFFAAACRVSLAQKDFEICFRCALVQTSRSASFKLQHCTTKTFHPHRCLPTYHCHTSARSLQPRSTLHHITLSTLPNPCHIYLRPSHAAIHFPQRLSWIPWARSCHFYCYYPRRPLAGAPTAYSTTPSYLSACQAAFSSLISHTLSA